jgi:hypothetical protein
MFTRIIYQTEIKMNIHILAVIKPYKTCKGRDFIVHECKFVFIFGIINYKKMHACLSIPLCGDCLHRK